MSITTEQAAAWFEERAAHTPMPGARGMFEVAAAALREKAEREDPKPLTIDELKQMDGEVVWVKVLDTSDPSVPYESCWGDIFVWAEGVSFWRFGHESEIDPNSKNYGKTWVCYRHKPKEV